MVTFTDIPSGPVDVSATSPLPEVEFQPSGSGVTITGATGSATAALAMLPVVGGGGMHATALGGMWSGRVTSTPGTGSAGSGGNDADAVVVAVARVAEPPVVRSQPAATPTHRQSRPMPSSVARKRKRNFGFHVDIRPARQVDV